MTHQTASSYSVAVVLPTCHGKTTFHKLEEHILDASQIAQDQDKLRSLRRDARVIGDWTVFDLYWSRVIRPVSKSGRYVILVPSSEIAILSGLKVVATIILPERLLIPILKGRPKSGLLNALGNRSKEGCSGHNVLHVNSYDDIKDLLLYIGGM